MSTDVSRLRELPPMDYPTARRLAKSAVVGDGTVVIGPRVLASLLAQIDALVLEREEFAAMIALADRRVDQAEARARRLPTLAELASTQSGYPT